MSLDGAQKVTVAEITRETYQTVDARAGSLNADQEASIVADLATWAEIRDSHLKIKGGRDGVDLDNERKREAIRERVRKALGLPLISYEVSGVLPLAPYAGGISSAEKQADNGLAEPMFRRDLFE